MDYKRIWGEESAVSTLTDTPFRTNPIPKSQKKKIILIPLVIIGERVGFVLEGAELWHVWIASSFKLGLTRCSLIIYHVLEPYLMRVTPGRLPTIPHSFFFHFSWSIDIWSIHYCASNVMNKIFLTSN